MNRSDSILIGGRSVILPCFFPSVSSVKTNLKPVEYLALLTAVHEPHFLISAYDVFHVASNDILQMQHLTQKTVSNGTTVLLDSGNYESYWRHDATWTQERFAQVLERQISTLSFCFDEQKPSDSKEAVISTIVAGVLRDQAIGNATIIPIVHARRKHLADVAAAVALQLRPLVLAVPERLLGDGICERAQTVFAIRQQLDKTDAYVPLHLLGTGNPRSILTYALCGADSFDGLEWCQTVADPGTGLLQHFQQREFVEREMKFVSDLELPYLEGTLVHNLLFYREWMSNIQQACALGKLQEFAATCLPEKFVGKLRNRLPGLFA